MRAQHCHSRCIGVLLALCVAFASAETLRADQIGILERRLKERPGDLVALSRLGELYQAEARASGNLRLYAKAEFAFRAALSEFADYSPALAGLASVQIALHRFSDVRQTAQKILAKNPANNEGHFLLADAEMALGQTKAAEEALLGLPDSPALFLRRGEMMRQTGQNMEAQKLFLRAVDEAEARADSPANICSYRVRAGEHFFRSGNFEAAGEQYRLALKLSPQDYAASEHMAELLGAQSKFAEARAQYEKVIVQSHRPDAKEALGSLYVFMHQPEQARRWHEEALADYLASTARGGVHFIHHLAGFYADVRQSGVEATKWARKDLELRNTPAAHDTLAWALYRAGEFGESRREIDAALASGIKDAHILEHAGMIYSAAGDLAHGQELLRETSELNPRYNSFHVHR